MPKFLDAGMDLQQWNLCLLSTRRLRARMFVNQAGDIEMTMNLWIASQKNLKSTIENESIHIVATDATTYTVRCFEKYRRDAALFENSCSSEPSKTRADNDDVGL